MIPSHRIQLLREACERVGVRLRSWNELSNPNGTPKPKRKPRPYTPRTQRCYGRAGRPDRDAIIAALRQPGATYHSVARQFGADHTSVRCIARRAGISIVVTHGPADATTAPVRALLESGVTSPKQISQLLGFSVRTVVLRKSEWLREKTQHTNDRGNTSASVDISAANPGVVLSPCRGTHPDSYRGQTGPARDATAAPQALHPDEAGADPDADPGLLPGQGLRSGLRADGDEVQHRPDDDPAGAGTSPSRTQDLAPQSAA